MHPSCQMTTVWLMKNNMLLWHISRGCSETGSAAATTTNSTMYVRRRSPLETLHA